MIKLGKIKFASAEEKQAENFRKMIMAMSQDIRVLLIKLADRSQQHENPATSTLKIEGMKIARETMDIYAPLANRLGTQWMKVELEDLSFKFLKPDVYHEVELKMVGVRGESEAYIQKVMDVLSPKLTEYGISHKISGRLKHTFSIYRKMQGQNISFEQVHDLIAFRIIVKNIPRVLYGLRHHPQALDAVPGRFKTISPCPRPITTNLCTLPWCASTRERAEFQIPHPTDADVWPSRGGSRPTGIIKKTARSRRKDQHKFQWVGTCSTFKSSKNPAEFFRHDQTLIFCDRCLHVFTPKGEVRERSRLPPPSTSPTRFIRMWETHCVGARVNERIVPLNYRLHSGDTIEILTQPHHKPSKDWLKFAVTSRAKSKIRMVIKEEQRERSIMIGKDLIEKEFDRFDLTPNKYLKGDQFENALRELGYTNYDTFSLSVGYGKTSPYSLVSKLVPKEKLQEKAPAPPKPTMLSNL